MPPANVDQNAQIELSSTGNYADYRQDNSYEGDAGLAVMPLAQRESGHRVIRLHGGYSLRRVKWQAHRAAQPPLIPKAANTIADTLLSHTVSVPLPSPNDEYATYDWQVSGEYLYVQDYMRVPGEDPLPGGQYPFLPRPQTIQATTFGQPYAAEWNADMDRMNDPDNDEHVNPNANLIEAIAETIPVIDGRVWWPFTTLPSAMSSSHIIQG